MRQGASESLNVAGPLRFPKRGRSTTWTSLHFRINDLRAVGHRLLHTPATVRTLCSIMFPFYGLQPDATTFDAWALKQGHDSRTKSNRSRASRILPVLSCPQIAGFQLSTGEPTEKKLLRLRAAACRAEAPCTRRADYRVWPRESMVIAAQQRWITRGTVACQHNRCYGCYLTLGDLPSVVWPRHRPPITISILVGRDWSPLGRNITNR